MSAFIVQDAVHADAMSRHDSQEEAVATVQESVRRSSAQPGELNVREIDATGRTIRVFGVGAQPLGSR